MGMVFIYLACVGISTKSSALCQEHIVSLALPCRGLCLPVFPYSIPLKSPERPVSFLERLCSETEFSVLYL